MMWNIQITFLCSLWMPSLPTTGREGFLLVSRILFGVFCFRLFLGFLLDFRGDGNELRDLQGRKAPRSHLWRPSMTTLATSPDSMTPAMCCSRKTATLTDLIVSLNFGVTSYKEPTYLILDFMTYGIPMPPY